MDQQDKSMKERRPAAPRSRRTRSADDPEYASGTEAVPLPDETPDASETRVREIRSEIDRTRDDMSETIDAIQDRISPRNVVSRAAENVREATIGKVRQMAHDVQDRMPSFGDGDSSGGIVGRIRANPVPAAIAAASLAWIAFSGRRRSRNQYGRAIYGSTRGSEPYIRETEIDLEDDDESAWRPQSGGGTEWSGQAHRSTRSATNRVRAVQQRAQRMADERPFAAGAIAAAVGLAIGLAIPETERENEMMGEAKDALIERGRETVRDAAGRVQNAAAEVQRVAGEALSTATSDKGEDPGGRR